VNPIDRQITWDHSRGWCAACGNRLGDQGVVHHRVLKGMGGKKGARAAGEFYDRPPITEVIHDRCHKWIHQHPARAKETGHIVPFWADVSEVPTTVIDELRRAA
jgi:hypothetical protein